MTAATRALASKELRALLPVWATAGLVIVAAGMTTPGRAYLELLTPAAFLAFTLGTAALGATAAGQDYAFGTLASALALPVSRRRVLLIKAAVLVPLTVALALGFLWANRHSRGPGEFTPGMLVTSVVLCAVCLAPWLTIATRNLLAGTLFPLSILAFVTIVSALVTTYGLGRGPGPEGVALRRTIFTWSMAVAWVAGGLLSWRAFMRFEAIEGPVAVVDLADWRGGAVPQPAIVRSRPAGPVRRVWLLALKELHLQQLSFVLAGLFTIAWMLVSFFNGEPAGWDDLPLIPIVPLFFAILSLLIGSLSSAEERQMGVLEQHALLPVRARMQGAVKATVTLAVSVLLACALPLALFYRSGGPALVTLFFIGSGVIVTTSFGMYISSLSASGVRAMAYAMAAGFAGVWYMQWIWRIGMRVAVLHHRRPGFTWRPEALWLLGVSALLIWLAYSNHRTLERGPRRVVVQVAGIAIFGALLVSALLLALTH